MLQLMNVMHRMRQIRLFAHVLLRPETQRLVAYGRGGPDGGKYQCDCGFESRPAHWQPT